MPEQLLLLERSHLTFESWFIRLFLDDLLPNGWFCLQELRTEYLNRCWSEEKLWKEWCDAQAQKE
jgi:hypothetical protein